jgi:uncharacterized protein (TIGR02145 family)
MISTKKMNVPNRWLALALLIGLYACNKKDNVLPAATNTLTDIDGNVYRFVTIGKQIWMAENLKTTQYNNKTKIQDGQSDAAWDNNKNGKIGAYCWYNTKNGQPDSLAKEYGRLYNFYAVKTGNLCPTGWHVPNKQEWQVLADTLSAIGLDYVSVLRDKQWTATKANNVTGFSSLPSGYRVDRSFINIGKATYYWLSDVASDTTSYAIGLENNSQQLVGNSITPGYKHYGFAVRCVKN